MSWQQLKIQTTMDRAEELSDLFSELGACAVTMEDSADQPIFEPPPGATPLWEHTTVVGLFSEDTEMSLVLQQAQVTLAATPAYLLETLEDKDWIRACMDQFQPIRFGNKLWIVPSWHQPPDPEAVNIMLDPGLAFGTGTHPTTALCLEWLDAHPPVGHDVLDYGCGSGILGIAALMLGAHHAWGVDTDPQAIIASRDNAQKNQVEPQLELYLPTQMPSVQADLIVANILANPLIELAPQLAAHLRSGGQIILSGILEEQGDAVLMAYQPWFEMQLGDTRDGWVRLEGRRK